MQTDIEHFSFVLATAKNKPKGATPTFTVRRTFTVRNTGQLPFYVHGFSINDLPCEGYGFRILDCTGFQMLPNDSKKIDIAYVNCYSANILNDLIKKPIMLISNRRNIFVSFFVLHKNSNVKNITL